MAGDTILIIRHAEKPTADKPVGVDESGGQDNHSLTPQGWQRAGAWASLFVPAFNTPPVLPVPTAIFASGPETHEDIRENEEGSRSRRPLETVTPLARKLKGVKVRTDFVRGQEQQLAGLISGLSGVILVCWQHESIPAIAQGLTPRPTRVPAHWPDDRFNVVYRFDRGAASWDFVQLTPLMLAGDLAEPIT
jgi:hypothetical protein